MDIQEYISSGILECYVLGQLTQEESKQIEALAADHTEIRQEIQAIEESLEGYAMAFAKTPPASLKASILSQVEGTVTQEKESKVIPIGKRNAFQSFLVAASVTLALISSVLAIFFWQKWQSAESRAFALEQENFTMSKNFNQVKQSLENRNTVITAVTDPNTKEVELKGLPISPNSRAIVFWNQSSKQLYINPVDLPEPPIGMQYQLWALAGGRPIDAGVFDISNVSDVQKMKDIQLAQAFAVTLERKGGSAVPTLEKMYVMGQI